MHSQIPIKNVYYLLLYAWDRVRQGETINISGVDTTELVNLYATVLVQGVRHLKRRGLEQTYRQASDEIAGIRGRVLLAQTFRRMLDQHGRAHCEFDELSIDTPANRLLKTALRHLSLAPTISSEHRQSLLLLYKELGNVRDIPFELRSFSGIQIHGGNSFYGFLVQLCRLILDSPILTEESGDRTLKQLSDEKLASLYERFVHNFYKRECPNASVYRQDIRWVAESETDPTLSYLPKMTTDTSFMRDGRLLVIETKFYRDTLQNRFGADKIHSANLYQLFAYLQNLKGPEKTTAEGMLLYPTVGASLRLRYKLGAHTVHVCTVNLGQDWSGLHNELLALVA